MNILKYVKLKDKILIFCPECNNNTFIYDYGRQEVYCDKCSLVVKNNDLMTLAEMEVYKLFDNGNDKGTENDG